MNSIKVHEKEIRRFYVWNASRYYDYPDGQDIVGKLKYTNKMAGLLGTCLGLIYVQSSRPTGVKEKCLRYFQILIPSLGAATAFTCVTYFSTNYRKKDDEINYMLGGLAAGAILIPFSGRVNFGVAAALVFAAVGYFKKNQKMKNLDLLPHPVRMYLSSYYTRHSDTSLEPDTRRGNWTK